MMTSNLDSKHVEQLLADADELIRQIKSDKIKDLEEEHRIQFEKHVQNLNRIRSEMKGRAEKEGAPDMHSGAEGMHQAIQDILKAVGDLTKYLS